MSPPPVRYAQRHVDEVVSLYVEDHHSLTEIERITGVKASTAHKMLVRRKVPRRPTGSPAPPMPASDLTRAVWLHQQGLTYEQIGEVLGLTESAVKYRVTIARKRLGYKGVNRGVNNRPKAAMPLHVRRAVEGWTR